MPYGKYSPKQKKLDAVAGDKKKITQADIITLKRRKLLWLAIKRSKHEV